VLGRACSLSTACGVSRRRVVEGRNNWTLDPPCFFIPTQYYLLSAATCDPCRDLGQQEEDEEEEAWLIGPPIFRLRLNNWTIGCNTYRVSVTT
jgi:hypothetical protein